MYYKLLTISRPISKIKTESGIICKMENKPSSESITQENPAINFNRQWPAIKFINKRTPKLIGLEMCDINSIGTNRRVRKKDVFDGTNCKIIL